MKEIDNKIKKLKESYQVELEDSSEESLSFLDQIDDLIKSIFNDTSLSVYNVFTPEKLQEWKSKRLKRWLKNTILGNINKLFYFALLVTITGFLVSEALDFYAVDGLIDTKTYEKAILTEVCFIFLSGYRSDSKWETAGVGVLRASIFCLMLFVITNKTFMDSGKITSNTDVIQQQVMLLEEQISEKNKSIIYYRDVKKWPLTTKQNIQEKNVLVNKLIILKEKQAEGATKEVSELVRYKAYGKAFFRVLLLFISILTTRRIFSF